MRQIGTVAAESQAKTLGDHLLTLGIKTRVNAEGDAWAVWVYDEDRVAQAREELEAFQNSPTDPRFQAARDTARALRIKTEQIERQYRRNVKDLSGQLDRIPLRRRPLTIALIAISIVVYLLIHVSHDPRWFRLLVFTPFTIDPQHDSLRDGFEPILRGEVWRLITPIFLHANLLHIFFNMWWLRDLGTLIETRRGTWKLAVLVLVSAVVSNTGQFIYTASYSERAGGFGGMSGVVYALLGYLWMKGLYDPEPGMVLNPRVVRFMLLWLVLCMTGMVGPVANAAHVIGLAVGMLCGLARL